MYPGLQRRGTPLRAWPRYLYASDARRCPVLCGLCRAVLEDTPRLYNCGRCGEQVRICRRCDRGNTYCAGACATIRRRESLHRASARYQQSYRGACRHAARQSAWRARRAQKVTHQGSTAPTPAVIVTLRSMITTTEVTYAESTHPEPRSTPCALEKVRTAPILARFESPSSTPRCSFCQQGLPSFARLGPLRR